MRQSWIIAAMLVTIYAIGMGSVLWFAFHSLFQRRMESITRPLAVINGIPIEDEPGMRRPAEFGPLLRPWEEIERVRAAIIADQLGARHESAAQRRRRMARMGGATEQDRVLHWLAHWQDYAGSLTGRGWAFQ